MVRRPGARHGEAMKGLRTWSAVLVLLLASCATVPVDGDAVDCDVCEMMWIRLLPASGAPGLYRLNHDTKRPVCSSCRELAMEYFETGRLPACCPRCRGTLTLRPVNIIML